MQNGPILAIGRKHNLTIIEDDAPGLLGTCKGRPLGGLGSVSQRLVRLPFYNSLSESGQMSMIAAVREFRGID